MKALDQSKQNPRYLSLLAMLAAVLWTTCLISQSRLVSLYSGYFSAAVLPYPFLCCTLDMIAELYGYKQARQVLWQALGLLYLFALIIFIFNQLPLMIELKNLAGKTALITGSATGIGKEIAIKLASHGANIIVHYNQSSPEATLQAIYKYDVRALAIHADFTDGINSAINLYTKARETFGNINILVNNAAVLYAGKIEDINEESYDELLLINTKVPYFLCREAIKNMPSDSKIINISTGGTKMILGNFSAYLTSKAALEQITRSLAVEAAEKAITINAVAAGATNTKMVSCFSQEELGNLAKLTPLKRIGEPLDIANVVTFLSSEEASWITGQVICVNGGLI